VSLRFIFALALCGVLLAALAEPDWNLRAALSLCGALLAGIALAQLVFYLRARAEDYARRELPVSLDKQTESARGGETLAPSDTLLRMTMNSMREGVIVVDESMRVVASNRAADETFNRAGVGALRDRRLEELTRNPAIHAAFRAALERADGAEVKVEMRDEGRRMFQLRVAPLLIGEETKSRGAIGVFFDITRLERLERVRQEFLSNVSHELRTPLTAILAYVETLEDGALEDQENNRRFLSVIRRNASRMHNLIDDILELSAIEAGNVQLEPGDVRLRRLVDDVATALATRAEERGVSIVNEVGEDVIVTADARRLEQMLTNLMDNAVKFNREGGRVTVSHERDARERIVVADTGDGIPAEHVERIFERFYRIDRARSRELGGTGLGLAIVKHLARAHGGEVSVRSSVGAGSAFIIELPLNRQDTTSASKKTVERKTSSNASS
jgi:two-component system phosphate regulon sensor histidine kinase PhoR